MRLDTNSNVDFKAFESSSNSCVSISESFFFGKIKYINDYFFLAHQTGQPGHLGWLTENRHTAADHRLFQFGRTPPQSQSVPFVQRCQQSLYNLVKNTFYFL